MADNVSITEGSGKTIAGDDISSVIHQRVKIEYGDDGSATDVSDTNPLPVDDAGGSLTVDNAHLTSLGGAISGTEVQVDVVGSLPSGTNAIGKLAANSGVDIGDVDVTSVPAPLSTTGGGTEATALRVTVASDSTGVISVDDNGGALTVDNGGTFAVQESGSALTALQLIDDVVATDDTTTHSTGSTKGAVIMAAATPTDGSVNANDIGAVAMTTDRKLHVSVQDSLPAGTNAIGKLSANSGVDIGDVDVASVSGNVTVVQSTASNLNTTEASASSIKTAVELIDDAVYVDDADWTDSTSKHVLVGGLYQSTPQTITDGDVGPIELDSTGKIIESNSAAIKTAVETIDNAISGSEMQVDVVTSALPSGASTLAEQQTQTTALQLIDDTVFVDDADWTADTSKHVLVGGVTQVASTANTDGDVTPLTTNAFRELRTAIPESDLATAGTAHVKKYYTNAGAVTDGIVWSPAAGKRWYVTDLILNVSAAATVTFEDDKAGGDEAVMKFELAANSGVSHTFNTPWFSGEDAADLIVTTTAGNVYITVVGYEI